MNGIEERVNYKLSESGIYPFSIVYSSNPQFLKISLYLGTDMDKLLEAIDYKNMCDNSGIIIIKDTREGTIYEIL